MSRRPSRRMMLAAALVFFAAALISGAIFVGTFALIQVREQAHAAAQANVRARYDDCQAGNRVLAGLRAQVRASRRTDPILFKLVPSLDTPEVHALVKAQREARLRTFAAKDCREYALEAIPPSERHSYSVPG